MTRSSSRKVCAALIVIGMALLLGARTRHHPEGQFVAEAVVQVVRGASDGGSSGSLREECSIIESTALLDGVISNLNLTAKWPGPNGQTSLSRVRSRLSSALDVQASEASDQVRLRVSGRNKEETEEIANSVLRVYQELRRAQLRESKPKSIVSLEDQLEDIEPRLRLAIDTMERVGKDLNITDVYVPPRPDPTLLDRIREGKEETEPANSSLFESDPAPKNETPEEAKRRIYLRSRRVAEALAYRKQRAEARLEYERRRHSTSESSSVQVVQLPEAVLQTSKAVPVRNRGWIVSGWVCIAIGVAGLFRTKEARVVCI